MLASLNLPPLALSTRLGLALSLVIVGLMVWRFSAQQNTPKGGGAQASGGGVKMGGKMSRAKSLWLLFTLLFWFCLCPLLALDPLCPTPWSEALLAFSASMWLRGIIELYMLYKTKNWRPRYGIAHDLSCLLLLPGVALWAGWPAEIGEGWARLSAAVVGVAWGAMCVELLYAAWFNKLVAGKTTGDEGIWFADEESALFKRVNRVTALNNIWLYSFYALVLLAAFGAFR